MNCRPSLGQNIIQSIGRLALKGSCIDKDEEQHYCIFGLYVIAFLRVCGWCAYFCTWFSRCDGGKGTVHKVRHARGGGRGSKKV